MALADNLVAYYSLDNGTDATGNGFDLTVTGATLATGKIGDGYEFNAITEKLERASDLGITGGACSVSLWFNPTVNPVAVDYIFNLGDAGTDVQYIIWYRQSGASYFLEVNRQRQNTSNNVVARSGLLATNTFYHVVLTYDGTTLRGYYNGSSFGTPLATSGNGAGGANDVITLGKDPNNTANSFVGVVDEVGVWSRAISAAEVTELYNAGAGLSYADITGGGGGGAILPNFKGFSRL